MKLNLPRWASIELAVDPAAPTGFQIWRLGRTDEALYSFPQSRSKRVAGQEASAE
jgi:hypothetical protein